MKLLLFALFSFGFSILFYAMEQKKAENFFPIEGEHFTGQQLLQKYGAWYPGYDTDDKFSDFEHHPMLYVEYRDIIIKKKLGNTVWDFMASAPDHEWAVPLTRYARAVTFRLSTICTTKEEVSDSQLIEAEGQIPYNYREYFYIRLGNNVNLTLYEEADIPSVQEYRKKLNSFLNSLKSNIENNHDE